MINEKIIDGWIEYIQQNKKHFIDVSLVYDKDKRPQIIFTLKKPEVRLGTFGPCKGCGKIMELMTADDLCEFCAEAKDQGEL